MDTTRPVDIGQYEDSGAKTVIPYGRRDFYKAWFVMGKCAIHYADKSILIDRPALIFSNPLVPYAYEVFDENYSGAYCLFTETFLSTSQRQESLQDSPLFKVGSHPVYFPLESQLDEIKQFFEKMTEALHSDYINKEDVIRNYIHLVLHEALKMEPVPTQPPAHDAMTRIAGLFQALLEKQFPIAAVTEQLQLRRAGDYARCLSVHVNHLNHAVRQVTGKSTSAHIKVRMIDEARALLKNTEWRVTDIAWCLGFDYPNHFNTFFRKHTGATPLSVRRKFSVESFRS